MRQSQPCSTLPLLLLLLLLLQVDMVSPLTQSQITLPVGLDRATAREQLWWLSSACRLLETRLLQVWTCACWLFRLLCAWRFWLASSAMSPT
jgi:hypothetical protein